MALPRVLEGAAVLQVAALEGLRPTGRILVLTNGVPISPPAALPSLIGRAPRWIGVPEGRAPRDLVTRPSAGPL
jgi:hypothetical protein